MSKLFSLKSLYFQYCTIASLFLIEPWLSKLLSVQALSDLVYRFISLVFYASIIYYLIIIYHLFKKLLYIAKNFDTNNKFVKNSWLPFLCGFPLTGVIYDPITIFQIGKILKSKLANFKLFNQLSILNLILSISYLVFIPISIFIFKQNQASVFANTMSLILTFLPMYLIGVLVFVAEREDKI